MRDRIAESVTLVCIIAGLISIILDFTLGLLFVIPAIGGVIYLIGSHTGSGLVGFPFKVAVGRGYSPLTMEKRQRLSEEGYAILDERDGSYVVIEAETMRGAIITAGDLGQRIGLMLLWR
jgi:hypothetical protein